MRKRDPYRILLVEDDAAAARLAARRLQLCPSATFAVTAVRDLQSALAELESLQYDVLLLDLGLPDGEGMSTLAAAGAIANHIPVVILTGNEDEEIALAAVQVGAQDVLLKRCQDSQSLARSILHAVERHRRFVAVRVLISP